MSRPLRDDEKEFLWNLLLKGYKTTHNGYVVYVHKVKKYKRSRILYQLYHNIFLYLDEIIHHINKDKTDDHITNLEIVDRFEHSLKHNGDMQGIKKNGK